jgi:hypothetical protein
LPMALDGCFHGKTQFVWLRLLTTFPLIDTSAELII